METLARGDVTVALAREHQIAVMLECGGAVFPFFFGRRWFLARGHDLVTSDNPVILWARNVPRGWGVGAMTADEVVVPIAPDRALVLLHPTVGTEESVVDLSESKSALLASRVRSYARRFTYRRPGTPLPPPLEMSAPTASAPTRGAAPADPEP